MRHNRFEWLARMKAVEREFAAIRQASDRFLVRINQDPTVIQGDLRPRDFERASEKLEGTYVMRLFAEFETGLRLFWATVRTTRPRTEHLISQIAGMRSVPRADLGNAQDVRNYRNALVHERENPEEPISIVQARRSLCKFFDRLPVEW